MIYSENLQIYLRLRLKLKKIHHALEFNQSQWLKPYIEFSNEKDRTIKKKTKKTMTKSIMPINKQRYIRKSNGKLKK